MPALFFCVALGTLHILLFDNLVLSLSMKSLTYIKRNQLVILNVTKLVTFSELKLVKIAIKLVIGTFPYFLKVRFGKSV